MSEDVKEKNIFEKISNFILIINSILAFIFIVGKYHGAISIINLVSLFAIIFIGQPINDFLKKIQNSNGFLILFTIKMALGLIFIISLYRMFLSQNYTLYYTYWLFLVSLVILSIIGFIEKVQRDYKARVAEGKKYNKAYVIALCLLFIGIGWFQGYFVLLRPIIKIEAKYIMLDEIKRPQSISVYTKLTNDEE